MRAGYKKWQRVYILDGVYAGLYGVIKSIISYEFCVYDLHLDNGDDVIESSRNFQRISS